MSPQTKIDPSLFTPDAERNLYAAMQHAAQDIERMIGVNPMKKKATKKPGKGGKKC